MCNPLANAKRCRGSSTLEFALCLPLILTVGLICVDFGRFARTHIAVTNAARAAAGFASMHRATPASLPTWQAAVRKAAEVEMAGVSWFDPAQMTMDPPPRTISDPSGLRRVEVTVIYPFETVVHWTGLPGYDDPKLMRRTVVMRLVR